MKSLMIITGFTVSMVAANSCNNKNTQVSNSSEVPAYAADSSALPTGNPYDHAGLIIDSLRSTEAFEDPARISVKDPLEGTDTVSKLNPPHGQPGHRCDVPVGAELSTMPKTQGMSLCK